MSSGVIIFAVLALVAVASAIGMLISQNSVYSALFLVVNFSVIAVLYLILGAPFIALAQITVYAGAIVVLFLFVIMMLGTEKLTGGGPIRGQRLIAILVGAAFLVEMAVFLVWRSGLTGVIPQPAADLSTPATIGNALFSTYTLPFEATSLILLAAVIGAIILTHPEQNVSRKSTLKVDQKKESRG
ncbi:MAG: NADH-quinone oxidoreductase subunit J [Anaerolineaceae bacterium]|nr:NADH-quinone oxidoreductase subunit J [Anaerolineaceae bacterium]